MSAKPEGYPLVYWPCIVGIFILLAIDIFVKGDQTWASIGTFVLVAVGVFTQPGGLMKRR